MSHAPRSPDPRGRSGVLLGPTAVAGVRVPTKRKDIMSAPDTKSPPVRSDTVARPDRRRSPREVERREVNHSSVVRTRWATIAVVMVIVVAVTVTSLPSRVHFPRSWRDSLLSMQTLVPQGWAFFTRDPREAVVVPYIREGARWSSANRGPNVQLRYLFGANREGRLTEFDISMVTRQAAAPFEWIPCEAPDVATCAAVAEAAGVLDVTSTGYDLRLCGEVMLVRQEPVPLAYARLGYLPNRDVARFRVTCQEPM